MASAATTSMLPAGADPFGVLTTTTTMPPGVGSTVTPGVVTVETLTVLPGPPGPSGAFSAPLKITSDAVIAPGQSAWVTTTTGQAVTLTVAVTPVGPSCRIKHTAASHGIVLVVPVAGAIDGATTWTLAPGQAIELDSDGATLAVF